MGRIGLSDEFFLPKVSTLNSMKWINFTFFFKSNSFSRENRDDMDGKKGYKGGSR